MAAAHSADAPVKTVGIIPASSGGGLGGDLSQCMEVALTAPCNGWAEMRVHAVFMHA